MLAKVTLGIYASWNQKARDLWCSSSTSIQAYGYLAGSSEAIEAQSPRKRFGHRGGSPLAAQLAWPLTQLSSGAINLSSICIHAFWSNRVSKCIAMILLRNIIILDFKVKFDGIETHS